MSQESGFVPIEQQEISVITDFRGINSENNFLGSIFVAEDIITADAERVAFGNVKFKRDFGPWKKDQIVPVLVFDNVFGYLQTEAEDEQILQQCKLKLEPDNVQSR